jgi:hypothetical protein
VIQQAGEDQVKNHETVQGVDFMDTAPLATVACLLTEIVASLGTVIMEVDELGEHANLTSTVGDKQTITSHRGGLGSGSESSDTTLLDQMHLITNYPQKKRNKRLTVYI